MNCWR